MTAAVLTSGTQSDPSCQRVCSEPGICGGSHGPGPAQPPDGRLARGLTAGPSEVPPAAHSPGPSIGPAVPTASRKRSPTPTWSCSLTGPASSPFLPLLCHSFRYFVSTHGVRGRDRVGAAAPPHGPRCALASPSPEPGGLHTAERHGPAGLSWERVPERGGWCRALPHSAASPQKASLSRCGPSRPPLPSTAVTVASSRTEARGLQAPVALTPHHPLLLEAQVVPEFLTFPKS